MDRRRGIIYRRSPRGEEIVPVFSTSLWIRDYLLEVGMDYVENMYRNLVKEKKKFGAKKIPRYQTFRNLIYMLKRLNLIRRTGTGPSSKKGLKNRIYYTLVTKNVNSPAWSNPRRYLYKKSWKKYH